MSLIASMISNGGAISLEMAIILFLSSVTFSGFASAILFFSPGSLERSKSSTLPGRPAKRLKFIRHARELGFGIEEVRELLQLSDLPETSCAAADAIARSHLEQIEIRLKKLQSLRKVLIRMLEECRHGRVCQCRVIEVLQDHCYCVHDH